MSHSHLLTKECYIKRYRHNLLGQSIAQLFTFHNFIKRMLHQKTPRSHLFPLICRPPQKSAPESAFPSTSAFANFDTSSLGDADNRFSSFNGNVPLRRGGDIGETKTPLRINENLHKGYFCIYLIPILVNLGDH